jgi:hypothetical protein
MKKLKSLQTLALAGVAVTFLATGCSSTSSGRADTGSGDERAAYRFASASGWVPITDVRQLGKFPLEWNPVSFESVIMEVPVQDSAEVAVNTTQQGFDVNLQPGDTFQEAAGAGNDTAQVKRVIKYTPFSASLR